MLQIEILLLGIAILLLLAVLASKASGSLGLPALVFFLAIGMLAGSDGLLGIYFDNPWLAQLIGTVALSYILFSGGLDTRWDVVRPVLRPAISLSTLGVALTAVSVGLFVALVLGWSWVEGILLGAIISSTDAAAVFTILRARATRLTGKLEQLLELESGSNDPMAIFLTIGFTRLVAEPSTPFLSLVPMFLIQFTVGGALGWLMGAGGAWLLNRIQLKEQGLYSVLSTALVVLIYGATASLGGNGFLAVYIAGIVMGNTPFVHRRSLTRYHEGLSWLLQIAMFLVLGLQVFPSELIGLVPVGLLLAAFLMFVARPLSVAISLLPFPFSLREKTMVAWVGLRGAAPIVLATFPLLAGLEQANQIFNLIFFVVLVSVMLQGTTLPSVGRLLKVNSAETQTGEENLAEDYFEQYHGDLTEFLISAGSPAQAKRIVDLDLPLDVLLVLIKRGELIIIPRGDITLEAGDRILVASDPAELEKLNSVF
jgi:cell volume regulation protein A